MKLLKTIAACKEINLDKTNLVKELDKTDLVNIMKWGIFSPQLQSYNPIKRHYLLEVWKHST